MSICKSCLCDTGKEIYTTFQHMKGASFCIHWTRACHWVCELLLSHLFPCSAIHFSLWHQGWMPSSLPSTAPVDCLRYIMCAMSEVVIFKFNIPTSPCDLCLSITLVGRAGWGGSNNAFLYLGWPSNVSLFSPVAPAIHEMKSHGVGLGRTALLRCEAAAVPSPTFEWYKGEKRWAHCDGIGCSDKDLFAHWIFFFFFFTKYWKHVFSLSFR